MTPSRSNNQMEMSSRPNRAANSTSAFKVTATSATKGNALLASKKPTNKQQQQQLKRQQQQQHRIVPAIEDFNLYDFCFNFRTLLACLLSSLIIYLLVWPLSLDCSQYRPTYTYISIIVSSVNLICIVVFTLFWYCNGVTRTLYANLSSSAFIITIYSILVAINLALAILFFFINTCHFQRLIKTSTTPLIVAITPSPLSLPVTVTATATTQLDPDQPIAMPLIIGLPPRIESTLEMLSANEEQKQQQQQQGTFNGLASNRNLHSILADPSELMINVNKNNKQLVLNKRWLLDEEQDRANEPQQQQDHQQHSLDGSQAGGGGNGYPPLAHEPPPPPPPIDYYSESPVEVAWEYLKEQVVTFKRKFNQFLQQYDLRFIGALHALCAICLQYMAMKVAVVRSYFCSPVSAYI